MFGDRYHPLTLSKVAHLIYSNLYGCMHLEVDIEHVEYLTGRRGLHQRRDHRNSGSKIADCHMTQGRQVPHPSLSSLKCPPLVKTGPVYQLPPTMCPPTQDTHRAWHPVAKSMNKTILNIFFEKNSDYKRPDRPISGQAWKHGNHPETLLNLCYHRWASLHKLMLAIHLSWRSQSQPSAYTEVEITQLILKE